MHLRFPEVQAEPGLPLLLGNRMTDLLVARCFIKSIFSPVERKQMLRSLTARDQVYHSLSMNWLGKYLWNSFPLMYLYCWAENFWGLLYSSRCFRWLSSNDVNRLSSYAILWRAFTFSPYDIVNLTNLNAVWTWTYVWTFFEDVNKDY